MSQTKTKAAVPVPPSKRASFMPSAIAPTAVPSNIAEKPQDMSFKVHPDFHREFKMTAAAAGLSMKDLLEEAFDAWKRNREVAK